MSPDKSIGIKVLGVHTVRSWGMNDLTFFVKEKIILESQSASNENVYKTFSKYVSFNVLSMLGLSCYILADTIFIANGLGSNGLAALNLVLPIYSLISAVGLMIGMGAATKYSILRAENNIDRANKVFTHAIISGIVIGTVLTMAGLFFSSDIMKLLGADTTILPMANQYLKTILLFSYAFIINNILVCFIRNDKNPNLSMLAMLIGSFCNIILDYIFIFPLNMGMFGAAFATGLAPIISILILSKHFKDKKNNFRFVKYHFQMKYISMIFSLGSATFITELSSGIIMLIFNFQILEIAGNIGVAAYGIIANLALIIVSIFNGVAQGIQPIVSHNYGKENRDNLKKIYFLAILVATFIGLLFYTLVLLYPNSIISIFNKEKNKELFEIALTGMKIYFVSFLIMGINIVSTSFFSSVSKPIQSFLISFARGGVLIIPLVLVLPEFIGLIGVWASIPLAELITLFLTILCIKKHSFDKES